MGTNYYLSQSKDCECCGRSFENQRPLHIGKSSFGWHFLLHVIPELGITSLEAWKSLWNKPGSFIRDEYGRDITAKEMIALITKRHHNIEWNCIPCMGYADEADFHAKNQSERGLNGLIRHRIDGTHCVRHGAGTWDLIAGEFS